MKRFWTLTVAGFSAAALLTLNTGCDWSTGGGTNAFNTSQGAGININFSGFYRGELDGGKAVLVTSAGSILTLQISQVGNSVTVIDNNGSVYTGTVGSPGLVAQPVNGVYPNGAELVQSQINFSGLDVTAGLEVQFSGIIHVVSVTDIQGSESSFTETDNETSTTTTSIPGDPPSSDFPAGTTETITVVTIGAPGDPFYSETTTTVVTDNATGEEVERIVTTEGTRTVTTEFSITEENSQYRLEGTWIELGGVVSQTKARAPSTAGLISTTDTDTTTTTN